MTKHTPERNDGTMSLATLVQPDQPVLATPSELSVKVELDERCFVYPDGKLATHLLLSGGLGRPIRVNAVFAFNHTRRHPRIEEFALPEARGLIRELINAVYYAKTSFFLCDTLNVVINVAANGYQLEFKRAEATSELFLSTGSIWRVIKGFLVAIDSSSPVVSH